VLRELTAVMATPAALQAPPEPSVTATTDTAEMDGYATTTMNALPEIHAVPAKPASTLSVPTYASATLDIEHKATAVSTRMNATLTLVARDRPARILKVATPVSVPMDTKTTAAVPVTISTNVPKTLATLTPTAVIHVCIPF